MTPLQQAMLLQGGGGNSNIPLLSILSLGNQSPPAVPPLGSNLPSYAAGSGGLTVPNAVDIQRANPSLPWYRAPGIWQPPPPPPPAVAAPAAAASSAPALDPLQQQWIQQQMALQQAALMRSGGEGGGMGGGASEASNTGGIA